MTIALESVIEIFENVLSGVMSRDEADRWAAAVIAKGEYEKLEYTPRQYEDELWESIKFICAFTLPDFEGGFLYPDDQLREELEKLKTL